MLSYEEFRDQWLKQHPSSVPHKQEIVSEYPNWVKVIVGAMFFASAVISGVHTAPTVRIAIEDSVAPLMADFAAAMSFVAVELALFVSAYLRHKNKGLAIIILITTMIVAVAANVVSVSKAMTDRLNVSGTDSTGAGTVAVILGVAIPVITLAAGEMFVHITSAGREERLAAERQYREDLKQIDAVILSAYRKYEKEVSAKVLSERTDRRTDSSSMSVRSDTDGQTSRAAFGHTRTADGLQKAIEWFEANPDKANSSLRELEPLVGVGRDTLSRARRQWIQMRAGQTEGFSSNGTGE